jgi:fimbrial chaperone protein
MRAAVVLLVLGLAGTAAAGKFDVTPTTVDLAGTAATSTITVRNSHTETTRFQVVVYAWRQDADGEMILEETEHLVVFPTLFSLAPGQAKALRVGTTLPRAPREQSFRIFVEELPPEQPAVGHIQVLARVGIPVFVAPIETRRDLRVTTTSSDIVVQNAGTVRSRLVSLTVSARDAGDREQRRIELPVWYFLSGDRRVFPMAGICADDLTLVVEGKGTDGPVNARVPCRR